MLQSLSKLYKKYHHTGTHQAMNLVGVATLLLYPLVQGFTANYLIGAFVGMLLITFVASAYYHRALSHRTWTPTKSMHYIFLTLGAAFWVLPAMYWVGLHRKHHRYYDTDQDPHGPMAGWKQNLLMVLYNTPAASYLKTDLKHEPMRWQNTYYLRIAVFTTLVMALVNPVLYFVAVGYVYGSFIMINTYGHWRGVKDSHILAIFSGGELYHKTHHEDQRKTRLGLFDLGYYGLIKWMK